MKRPCRRAEGSGRCATLPRPGEDQRSHADAARGELATAPWPPARLQRGMQHRPRRCETESAAHCPWGGGNTPRGGGEGGWRKGRRAPPTKARKEEGGEKRSAQPTPTASPPASPRLCQLARCTSRQLSEVTGDVPVKPLP